MKTVISASRRTDIPAFYLKWFMEAVREGHVTVANPFYPQQTRLVDLRPSAVGWIVFWSRNYRTFLKHHGFFDAYQLFFHFTILPPSKLEKVPIDPNRSLEQLARLTQLYGAERIIWRYDPLVYWQENDRQLSNHDEDNFAFLCREISQMGVTRCYTSFAYPYAKFQSRFKRKFTDDALQQPATPAMLQIIKDMQTIAAENNIDLYTCCNDALLQAPGVRKGRCIDGHLLNALAPAERVSEARTPTRKDCGCSKSIDIGDYRKQPCPYGCIYCYANPLWK